MCDRRNVITQVIRALINTAKALDNTYFKRWKFSSVHIPVVIILERVVRNSALSSWLLVCWVITRASVCSLLFISFITLFEMTWKKGYQKPLALWFSMFSFPWKKYFYLLSSEHPHSARAELEIEQWLHQQFYNGKTAVSIDFAMHVEQCEQLCNDWNFIIISTWGTSQYLDAESVLCCFLLGSPRAIRI